jgi:hypothetical protein
MKVRKLNHSVCTRSAEWLSAEAKASASFVPASPLLEMVSSPIASLIAAAPRAFRGSCDRKPSQLTDGRQGEMVSEGATGMAKLFGF